MNKKEFNYILDTDIEYESDNNNLDLWEKHVMDSWISHHSPARIARDSYVAGLKRAKELFNM